MSYTSRAIGSLIFTASLVLGACSGNHVSTVPGPSAANPGTPNQGSIRHPQSLPTLAAYNIDKTKTTVAGISSGGFMAVQLHFAFSKTFHFAAIYAGGVDYCAADSLTTAQVDCQYASASELSNSESYIDSASSAGTIDPTSNMNGDKAYLWSGTADYTVEPPTMKDLNTEYQHYGVTTDTNFTTAANHGWESPDGPVACGTLGSPYIINCNNYDSEKQWMTDFYGTLNAKNTGTLGGTVINVDQTAYGGGANDLDSNGYLFVPANCASGAQCKLIVALGGCKMTQSDIGTAFITDGGIDKWADTNSIIVLYPFQLSSSTPTNPNGCWDWWGFEGSNYALQSGPQMQMIIKMVNRIQSGGGPTPTPSPSPTPPGPTPTPSPTPHSTPTPSPTPTPAPTATPTPAPTATPTPGWSQQITATVLAHYVAGRINVTQYNILGAEYGYLTNVTLYDCSGSWTNHSNCAPLS